MATAGAPEDNKNAEIWDKETAEQFMIDSVEKSKSDDYDFIGEVAKDMDQDKGVFDYIIKKFPELKKYKKRIKNNCEVNCFRNGKKGKINTAIAIVNLKSNHNWTDRQDMKSKGKKLEGTLPPQITFVDADE